MTCTCKEWQSAARQTVRQMFLSSPQQCAFTILMSGQLASQDWQPASRNQRRRLDQTSREKCLTPHFHSIPPIAQKTSAKMGVHRDEWHQLDDLVNANIWDSSADLQSRNDESYSCHSAQGETAQFKDNLTNSFMFSFIVLPLRDTFTWAGSFSELAARSLFSQRENRLRFHYLS